MMQNPKPPLALPGGPGASPEEPGQTQPAGARATVIAPVLRHWLMVLLVWLVGSAVAVPAVWIWRSPVYTATAQIKVDPILSNPFDRQMQTIPLFESFVASQALLIESRPVLEAALADPQVQALPPDERPQGVSGLRASLEVTPAARTQIIQVSVSNPHERSAIVLTDAVLNAYLSMYGGTADIDQDLRLLEGREKDLLARLDARREERRRFSDEFKADTEMLEKLRERDMKMNEAYRQQLAETRLRIIALEQDIAQMKAGKYVPGTEAGAAQIREAVARDPDVLALERLIFEDTAYLTRNRAGMSEKSRSELEAQIEARKEQLQRARVLAAQRYEQSERQLQEKLREEQIRVREDELEREKHTRDRLAEEIARQEALDRRMGQISIELGRIDEEIAKLTAELERVEAARNRLELEKAQPGRVSKASAAEILPEGYSDKRPKLTAAAIMGSLFLGIFLAIVRGRLDARLHAPEQVVSTAGLQILGAVPAINDLRKGRITEEEFAEAYRILRVSILSPARGEPPRSILITSAQAREGKTSLALSLSVSLAETGKRVLLIDADLQAPKIGNLLGIESPSQLQYVLAGQRELAVSTVPSRLRNVDVLLGGPYADGGLVEHRSAERLIQQASARYDYVVVDSSPALGSADALVWSQVVDRVVVSTLLGSSDIHSTQHVCRKLAMVGARVLGAVVCNVPVRGGFSSCPSSTYRSYWSSRSSSDAHDVFYLPNMRMGEAEQPTG